MCSTVTYCTSSLVYCTGPSVQKNIEIECNWSRTAFYFGFWFFLLLQQKITAQIKNKIWFREEKLDYILFYIIVIATVIIPLIAVKIAFFKFLSIILITLVLI